VAASNGNTEWLENQTCKDTWYQHASEVEKTKDGRN